MNISNALSNIGVSGAGPAETRYGGVGGTGLSGTGLSATVESGAAASSTGRGNVSSGDEVSLSGVSQILQSSSAQRTEALASLTSSVRAGSYNTSSADVGHSMISEILAQAAGR